MLRKHVAVLGVAVWLVACGDPEEAAQQALEAVKTDWSEAQSQNDPEKRVKAYQTALDDLATIRSKYEETRVGAALAAGRTVDGLSQATMQSEYDRLAARAACYANPTAECLLPFASQGFRTSRSSGDLAQQAVVVVCEQDFKHAEAALEGVKINRPVYASNLVQVALHAAQCDKPEAVREAITAYLSAEPAQGADRISKLMGILQTDALRAAWPDVLGVLEKEIPSAGLDPGTAAGTDLTLAIVYADTGDADKALAKFRHVTEELGYTADVNTRKELASTLIAGGHSEAGMALVREDNVKNLALIALHDATAQVGGRLGVIRPKGAATANVPLNGDLAEFFAPVSDETRKTEGAIADQIEVEVDTFVAPLQPTGEWLGMAGAETVYGMLALVQQKLGAADKATALVAKAEETRSKLSRPGAYKPDSRSYVAEFQLLVALGQGDVDKAVSLLKRVQPVGNDDAKLIFVALARKGEAEEALTLAAQTNRASGQTYELLINELGSHGHAQQAEAVLNSFPGSAQVKSAMAWSLVEKTAQSGDINGAQAIAGKYRLLDKPAYRLRMTELQAEAAVAGGDRGAAELAIREFFTQADELDKQAAQSHNRSFNAENAAALAFKAGYTDLGLELYRSATSKDQRPFFAAFNGGAKAEDYPGLLLAAHDNLRGEQLGYVIDSAIRGLQQP